jgi:hypothetical protein
MDDRGTLAQIGIQVSSFINPRRFPVCVLGFSIHTRATVHSSFDRKTLENTEVLLKIRSSRFQLRKLKSKSLKFDPKQRTSMQNSLSFT